MIGNSKTYHGGTETRRKAIPEAGVARGTSLACKFIGGGNQGASVGGIKSAVATIWGDDEFGFGPGAMERPGAFHGADHVITALHDDAGNVADARSVAQELVIAVKESLVEKIVGLNAGEGESELVLLVMGGKTGIGHEL